MKYKLFALSIFCFYFITSGLFSNPLTEDKFAEELKFIDVSLKEVNRLSFDPKKFDERLGYIKASQKILASLEPPKFLLPEEQTYKILDSIPSSYIKSNQPDETPFGTQWADIPFSKEDFSNIFKMVLEKNKPENYRNVTLLAVNGLFASYDPDSKIFSDQIQQVDFGIGVKLRSDSLGRIFIEKIDENSPGEKVGLTIDDQILSVNEIRVTGKNPEFVEGLLEGKEKTKLKLGFIRSGLNSEKTITVSTEPEPVLSKNLQSKVFGKKSQIAYIRILSFNNVSEDKRSLDALVTEEFKKIIEESKVKGNKIQGIVLDLRQNQGGLLNLCISVADLFLKSGIVTDKKEKNRSPDTVYASPNQITDIPLFVLINFRTAVGAELVAGALRANYRAVLIGEPSYGSAAIHKLSIHPANTMNEKYFLKIWAGQFSLPTGESLEGRGIKPDILVSETENGKFPIRKRKKGNVLNPGADLSPITFQPLNSYSKEMLLKAENISKSVSTGKNHSEILLNKMMAAVEYLLLEMETR
ncbi:S41 family peptidase [Leptospira johnsonii]|uniref:S41 family peptidase n=1 Tax=Leptospira johnsonii TaxID=1917820 RepID=UPI000D595D01|nr:S41 family peptidase [Leptospira johnsonii]